MNKNLITMRTLGRHGRFGNQLFQYGFLQAYAQTRELQVQVPPWVGNHLFGLRDAQIDTVLPNRDEERPGGYDAPSVPPKGGEFCGTNFSGYAQFHTSWYKPYRELLQSLYLPIVQIHDKLTPALQQLRTKGKTRIGLHFRRGDYGRQIFYYTPTSWCLEWLEENWARFDDPALFIATEDPALAKDFAKYNPVLIEDLGIELRAEPYEHFTYLPQDLEKPTPRGMDFYPEFWMLSQCEVQLICNSTFSFCAAMLNKNLQECWRSDLPSQGFKQIDPWNADPITYDKIEDHPEAKGVADDANRYW